MERRGASGAFCLDSYTQWRMERSFFFQLNQIYDLQISFNLKLQLFDERNSCVRILIMFSSFKKLLNSTEKNFYICIRDFKHHLNIRFIRKIDMDAFVRRSMTSYRTFKNISSLDSWTWLHLSIYLKFRIFCPFLFYFGWLNNLIILLNISL